MGTTKGRADETFEVEVSEERQAGHRGYWPMGGPFRMFAPLLERSAPSPRHKIAFVKLNIDENLPAVSQRYCVMPSRPCRVLRRAVRQADRRGQAEVGLSA